MEGMTPEKANEMAINKTVQMCRASARTDLARAVIASTKFNDPKEVVSAFVVEIGQEAEEKHVLAYRVSQQNKNNNNRNSNKNFYQNNNNGGGRGNYRGRGNRGRGGQRGGNNRYNNNNNSNYNNNNSNYQNNQNYQNYNGQQSQNNDRNVRYVNTGNGQQTVPDQRGLADNQNEI